MNSVVPAAVETPGKVRFLGSQEYAVRVAADGTGSSAAGNLLLTRDDVGGADRQAGLPVFLRDRESGEFVVIGQGGAPGVVATTAATFSWQPGLVSILQTLEGVEARLDICVAPHATFELRRVTLTNCSDRPRLLDVTTFAEVVLNQPGAQSAHPAFARLFLQTEFDARWNRLSVRRRPRDPQDTFPLLVHAFLGDGDVEYETSRPCFVGRGGPGRRPAAMTATGPLSGTTGTVLDPIVSLRRACRLAPGQQQEFAFLLGVAADAPTAARLVETMRVDGEIDRVFAAATADETRRLAVAEVAVPDEQYYQDLAGVVLGGRSQSVPLREASPVLDNRILGDHREALLRLGLSLDREWVVVHAETPEGAANQATLLRAAGRWRELDLPVQLIIIDGDESVAASRGASDGRILTIAAADLTPAQFHLLNLAARLVVTERLPVLAATGSPAPAASGPTAPQPEVPRETLQFDNGYGGFNADGDEYVIRLRPEADGRLSLPPVPWTNVIANEDFGFVVSETGAGCTWFRNSRENRLTPWSNDAVRDPHGDAYYLRDDDTGTWFSCLPGPAPAQGAYETRHGFGYSTFQHTCDGLELATMMFVPRTDPLRVTRITITNTADRPRRLSLFGCAQLVLGGDFRRDGRFVNTWRDDQTGALLARNPLSAICPQCVAFSAVVADPAVTGIHHTCDLSGFLGADGDFAGPAALGSDHLDGRAGTQLESCFAHQAVLSLAPGQTATVSFLLGEEGGADWARDLVVRYRSAEAIETARQNAASFWRQGLSALQVRTPSPALDLMVNGWLPYQTLSCRIRGRTAFYQSGGAFGFRDQLQDASSLVPLWPERTRQQILLNAAHQFGEGDVMHWWHTPHGQGIRTRFADDLLWLPLLTAEYIAATGDWKILDERAPYLDGRALAAGEDEVFLWPTQADDVSDLYEHCCRALDRSLRVGEHGLPLFGTGDWNDGMNRVGREGRGESVWMGFFLVMVLEAFAPLCRRRDEAERAERYSDHVGRLKLALNEAGWDGDWYRRGYYDNGAPLGSHLSDECRIDALAQAWAVLSGVAPPERVEQALRALEEHLVVADPGLIKLLAPPFVDTPNDPGYIKGYVAGVRENGGQYTHAALWVVKAMAKAGRRERAAALLDLLNPVLHAATPEQVAVYQVEPYVVAADVYGAEPHVGRGGWTWYTGSSGWMHRVAVESVLGLHLADGDTLVLDPCIPDTWPGFELTWRLPGHHSTYHIRVANPDACSAAIVQATVDGAAIPATGGALRIPVVPDGQQHEVVLTLGAASNESSIA